MRALLGTGRSLLCRMLGVIVFGMTLLSPMVVQAGLFDSLVNDSTQPLPVDKAYVLRLDSVAPGQLDLVWQIEPDYYLYQDKVVVTPGEGVAIVDRRDAPAKPKDDPLFGRVQVYYDEARVSLLLGSTSGSERGELTVTYQGCWEGGICYPPVTEKLEVVDLIAAAGLSWPGSTEQESAPAPSQATAVGANADAPVKVSEQDRFASLLTGTSLAAILGAFFLAGLALSLTPCVFPMIPILSGVIVGHGHKITTLHAFLLSLVYVLAMSLTYTVAGIVIGLFGANVQVALQNPWVISIFALLFVLLACSMFGFYELQMPRWLQSRVSEVSAHQKSGSVLGVAIMGLLSALIVGPCMAAPLAGALIYIGQTGDPVLGGAALFVLSLGMGVPLLLVGASAGKLLPKAGSWMEGVKAAFGVILLLMAVWMLDRILPVEVTMAMIGIILIISAVYLNVFERLGEHTGGWHRLWKGLGMILLVYGAALLIGLLSGGRSLLYPLQGLAGSQVTQSGYAAGVSAQLPFTKVTSITQLDPLLRQAAEAGQPVMLDFYADWCVSCVELEYVTFADSEVQRRLAGVKLIKVDVTANDDESKALNQRYQVFGPPVLFFVDGSGQPRPEMTMVGFVEPNEFLTRIATL
ncbi:thiol:disulfide interchange protein DsbD [Marinobacterium zhoushanense]|uniref:Thiol:disulfide interchange protein DsbD n=1 Tax=Marinobacterium zhoushanense TaxID=1679163 RepID=A0ABQ1KKH5_9GAMM|nr:protein-disulfide reductase DsbD [Marinobacterium zhoushanense]GGC03126.1 thiol:disulfide interchange protein DsbD [Marinobacterium zhoushanense]